MPDWLRKCLIFDLPEHREKEIRQVIHNLLITATDKPLDGFELSYAKTVNNIISQVSKYLMKTMIRNAPKSSPLNDHIFITFMSDRLSVRLPKILYQLFHGSKHAETSVSEKEKEIGLRIENTLNLLMSSTCFIWIIITYLVFMKNDLLGVICVLGAMIVYICWGPITFIGIGVNSFTVLIFCSINIIGPVLLLFTPSSPTSLFIPEALVITLTILQLLVFIGWLKQHKQRLLRKLKRLWIISRYIILLSPISSILASTAPNTDIYNNIKGLYIAYGFFSFPFFASSLVIAGLIFRHRWTAILGGMMFIYPFLTMILIGYIYINK